MIEMTTSSSISEKPRRDGHRRYAIDMSRSFLVIHMSGVCEVLVCPCRLTAKSPHPRRSPARLPEPAWWCFCQVGRQLPRPLLADPFPRGMNRARAWRGAGHLDRRHQEHGDGQHDTAHDLLAPRHAHDFAVSLATAM